MTSILAFIFLSGLLVSSAGTKSYDGYSVYRIHNYTKEQFLDLRNDPLLDFVAINDVMVTPDYKDSFLNKLNQQGIAWEILVPDVQITIDAERWRQYEASTKLKSKSTLNLNPLFIHYFRYNEIEAYIKHLAAKYPKVMTVASIGKSSEGRDIPVLKISGGKKNRPVILIEAGMHGREWIATAMALYIIQELVGNSTNADLISSVDWHIIPLLNPDGYEFSHIKVRGWRKSRSVTQFCPETYDNRNGADINRNFDFHWNEIGTSKHPCEATVYPGRHAFSELESRALRDYVKTTSNIKMYFSIHSHGSMILYPWGYTHVLPSDSKTLEYVAKKAEAAQILAGGKPYVIGSIGYKLHPASGTSADWVRGVGGVNFSYTIQLPRAGIFGWEMPANNIAPVIKAFFPAVRVFGEYVASNWK